MTPADIDVLILTFNEEPNLRRTLDALKWARSVLVVDSGSMDGTLAIIADYPTVRVLTRGFDSFAEQCNFGLQHLSAPWILSLDADHVLSPELTAEVAALEPGEHAAFEAPFCYVVHGRALRASLLPPRPVLFRRGRAHYVDDGHAHRLVVNGRTGALKGTIAHDDRKPLRRWFHSQAGYAEREAEKLLALAQPTRLSERIRLIPGLAPPAAFIYTLLIRATLLDGWRGWFYALQRALAEIMILLALMDLKAQRGK